MDGLLAEINKRKAEDFAPSSKGSTPEAGPSKNKYQRRGDAERERERAREEVRAADQRKREEEAEAETERRGRMRKEAEDKRSSALAALASDTPDTGSPAPDVPVKERFNITAEECIRRLRAKGQPIRLFGETDHDRRQRLRALELAGDRGNMDQVDFKRAVADLEAREQERRARGEEPPSKGQEKDDGEEDGEGEGGSKAARRAAEGPLDLSLIKTDFNKLHPLIYWGFKNLLSEWEAWLDARPEATKRTSEGKMASANRAQSAQNLKPLFRGLRNRDLPEGVVRLLAEVVHYMQKRSYQRANDAYLRLSIGNAAWPLGVTSVGIHQRSSREKITDNVAHVLNDEVSRKYIQAVKRLLTFSQTVRPPDDISQMMG